MIKIMIKKHSKQDSKQVSKCLIVDGTKVLFLLRKADDSYGNTWDLPGGHIKYGETIEEGMKREVFEECGLVVKSTQRSVSYKDRNHIFFISEDWSGKLLEDLPEHQEAQWVEIKDIPKYNMGSFYQKAVDTLLSLSERSSLSYFGDS